MTAYSTSHRKGGDGFSGVARKPIVDMEGDVARLKGRLDPVAGWLQSIFDKVRDDPKRVVFAEGEDLTVIRAANTYFTQGFGAPILVGTKTTVVENLKTSGIPLREEFELVDTRTSPYTEEFTEYLFKRLRRCGYLSAIATASSSTSATYSRP